MQINLKHKSSINPKHTFKQKTKAQEQSVDKYKNKVF